MCLESLRKLKGNNHHEREEAVLKRNQIESLETKNLVIEI